MITHALGWRLTNVSEKLQPVIAEACTTTGCRPIREGMARGVEQVGRGYVDRNKVVELHFRAAVREPKSFDRVEIRGEPDLVSAIEGGMNGDVATGAIVLNAVRPVLAADPGQKTILDVLPVTCSDREIG